MQSYAIFPSVQTTTLSQVTKPLSTNQSISIAAGWQSISANFGTSYTVYIYIYIIMFITVCYSPLLITTVCCWSPQVGCLVGMVFLDSGQPVCFIDRLQNSSAISVGHHRLMRPTSFLVELDPLRLRHGIDDNRMNLNPSQWMSVIYHKRTGHKFLTLNYVGCNRVRETMTSSISQYCRHASCFPEMRSCASERHSCPYVSHLFPTVHAENDSNASIAWILPTRLPQRVVENTFCILLPG